MMFFSPEETRTALQRHVPQEYPPFPGRTNHRRAAILIPLQFLPDGDARCLLIRRASHLRDHAGEVGFPGGKPEPDDASMAETALRETEEELGLPRTHLQLLGRLSSFPLFTSDYRLEPYVAVLPADARLSPSPAEVAALHMLSLRALFAQPFTHALPFRWEGRDVLAPIFALQPRPLYGGSAYALWELLTLLGAPPPLQESPTFSRASLGGT